MGLPSYLIDRFPPEMREPMGLFSDWVSDHGVHREDFTQLKNLVSEIAVAQKDLTAAQQRTEQSVVELAEAQKRTEHKVEELAEAQKRTEHKVEELAEAQKRTEHKVEELAEAQKRTENKVEELAEAQKRTEQAVKELGIYVQTGFEKLDQRITNLGSRWGIYTENVFRNTIKHLLENAGYEVRKGIYGNREVDVVISNGDHILLEITSSLKRGDVAKLNVSADDYREKVGFDPGLMIAATFINPNLIPEIYSSPRKIQIFSYEED